MAATTLGAATAARLITSQDVILVADDGTVVYSWKSNRIHCYKNHGRRHSSVGFTDSRCRRQGGRHQRRNCLNLNSKHGETSAERKYMLQELFNTKNKEEGFHRESAESPWDGSLSKFLVQENVVYEVTSNSAIVDKAVTPLGRYHDRYRKLMQEGCPGVEDAYWELVIADVKEACDTFRPINEHSRGRDGYVSVEAAPYLAHDGVRTLEAANWLHGRIDRSNVYIRIPSTEECLPAIRNAVSLGISVNSTLIFSLKRYKTVAEAYLQGLESIDPRADLSHVSGVACFFVSSVNRHVNQKLEELGTKEALSYRGKAAGAIAALALDAYRQIFSGPRWEALEKRGAKKQRLLWASTNTQNTLYVTPLSTRPLDTVNLPPQEAYLKHDVKVVETSRPRRQCEEDGRIYDKIQELGVCWSDVAQFLEHKGINTFQDGFESALTALVKADLEYLFSQ